MPRPSKRFLGSLAELHRRLAESGYALGPSGNASATDPRSGVVWIKASGVRCGEVTVADLVPTVSRGFAMRSRARPSVDLLLHEAVYQANPETRCVIHTHSLFASAFSITGTPLPTLTTTTAEVFAGSIPCVPLALSRTALAQKVAVIAQAGGTGCLLERHGTLVWGDTMAAAFRRTEVLEWSAHLACIAHGLGRFRPLSRRDIERQAAWYQREYGQEAR